MRGTTGLYRKDFYPRPPRGGRQRVMCAGYGFNIISIHALREEGDAGQGYGIIRNQAISIHALREEGDRSVIGRRASFIIFLSTPSARRATRRRLSPPKHRDISIHALREEGDNVRRGDCGRINLFLSTPSARRATSTDRVSH